MNNEYAIIFAKRGGNEIFFIFIGNGSQIQLVILFMIFRLTATHSFLNSDYTARF